MKTLPINYLKVKLKSRVGYVESDNKEEFMKGVGMAYDIISDQYSSDVKFLTNRALSYKRRLDELTNALKVVSNAIGEE